MTRNIFGSQNISSGFLQFVHAHVENFLIYESQGAQRQRTNSSLCSKSHFNPKVSLSSTNSDLYSWRHRLSFSKEALYSSLADDVVRAAIIVENAQAFTCSSLLGRSILDHTTLHHRVTQITIRKTRPQKCSQDNLAVRASDKGIDTIKHIRQEHKCLQGISANYSVEKWWSTRGSRFCSRDPGMGVGMQS